MERTTQTVGHSFVLAVHRMRFQTSQTLSGTFGQAFKQVFETLGVRPGVVLGPRCLIFWLTGEQGVTKGEKEIVKGVKKPLTN